MKRNDIQKVIYRPLKLFIEILLAIAATEGLVMMLLHFFIEPLHLSELAEALIDSFSLLFFVSPILYLLFYRTMSLEIFRHTQSRETHEAIIRSSIDGFWESDTKGNILDVNDAYCRLIGYSRDELLTMNINDLEAVENQEETGQHIKKIMETGSDRFETRHRRKDGRVVDIDVSVNYLHNDGGRFIVFLRDITERRRRENKLRQANTLNQTILQTIPFGMDIVDMEGNILYLSPKLEAMLGREAIGRKCWELYRDNKMQCVDCPLRKEFIPGETAVIETSGVFGGRNFQISHTGMEYEGKKAILEIFHDITERKKSEEELRRLSAAVNQTADIVVITDRNGLIEYVNPAFEAETGYSREEAIGKSPRIVKSGIQDKAFYEQLWHTILSGEVFRGVLVNRKKGGEFYYSQKTITPIKDEQGSITHFVSTDKDITDYKLYEQELLRANQELLKLDQLKSEFITNVSHELRTPIAMIKEGVSQVAEGLHGELREKQSYYLNKALNNVDRLTRIVSGILDIAGLEAGKAELKKENISTVNTAEQVISHYLPYAKEKNLEIKTQFPSEIAEISADKNKLTQVFINLIDNAIKFTEKGNIEVRIQDKDSVVEVSVSDTGIGISQDDLPKVFDRFQQFSRAYGPGEKGVGLGLAIVKEIIELHGGKVWVESQPGKGTKFSFWLPKG